MSDTFKAKYNWAEDEIDFHEEIIGSSVVAGMWIGAGLAGKIM